MKMEIAVTERVERSILSMEGQGSVLAAGYRLRLCALTGQDNG